MAIRKLFFGFLFSLLIFSSSCGLYTNIPAQYHVSGDSDMVATITFDTAKNANVKLPVLVIEGEPGSIGITFTRLDVNYSTSEVASASYAVTYRVDSSHLTDKDQNLIVKKASFTLPVVDSKVIEIGRRNGARNIAATLSISGVDDAGWPHTFEIGGVPIIYIAGPST